MVKQCLLHQLLTPIWSSISLMKRWSDDITDMWRQIFLSKAYAAIDLLTAQCKARALHQGTTQTAQPFVLP